jgi:hypothetical protein
MKVNVNAILKIGSIVLSTGSAVLAAVATKNETNETIAKLVAKATKKAAE